MGTDGEISALKERLAALDMERAEYVEVARGNQVFVDRTSLPPALVTRILRIASYQNPELGYRESANEASPAKAAQQSLDLRRPENQ
jgi:hypothetical protein